MYQGSGTQYAELMAYLIDFACRNHAFSESRLFSGPDRYNRSASIVHFSVTLLHLMVTLQDHRDRVKATIHRQPESPGKSLLLFNSRVVFRNTEIFHSASEKT